MGLDCDQCRTMKVLHPHLYGQNTIEELHVLHELVNEAVSTADMSLPRDVMVDAIAIEIAGMSPTIVRMSQHYRGKDDLLEVPDGPQLPVTAGLVDTDGDGVPDYRDNDEFEWNL